MPTVDARDREIPSVQGGHDVDGRTTRHRVGEPSLSRSATANERLDAGSRGPES